MRYRHILLCRLLATGAVYRACGDDECAGCSDAGAGVVDVGVVGEEGEDCRGWLRGEEEADGAVEVGGELGEGGEVFVFWGAAEGFGHYFCFAEEDADGREVLVSTFAKASRKEDWRGQNIPTVAELCPYVF